MLSRQQYWHALPDGLGAHGLPGLPRCPAPKLMGHVVRDAYAKLNEHGYTPVYPEAGQAPAEQSDDCPLVDPPWSAPSRPDHS